MKIDENSTSNYILMSKNSQNTETALNNEKLVHIMASAVICKEIRYIFGIGKSS